MSNIKKYLAPNGDELKAEINYQTNSMSTSFSWIMIEWKSWRALVVVNMKQIQFLCTYSNDSSIFLLANNRSYYVIQTWTACKMLFRFPRNGDATLAFYLICIKSSFINRNILVFNSFLSVAQNDYHHFIKIKSIENEWMKGWIRQRDVIFNFRKKLCVPFLSVYALGFLCRANL